MHVLLLSAVCLQFASSKIHHLTLRGDARRNIPLTSFGYAEGGTFDLVLINFTVPETILEKVDSRENADKSGVIGFSLSRGNSIASGVGSNPHVCQLQQTDQGFDALFFFADLPQKRLRVFRSGAGKQIHLCPSHDECAMDASAVEPVTDDLDNNPPMNAVRTRRDGEGWLDKFKRILSGGDSGKPYEDYVPLVQKDLLYSANISIRFPYELRGKYHFIYHNCFNYRAHGYSDRVAVDFTVWIVERNVGSFLSAGDIPKPQLFLYVSLAFVLSAALWCRLLCLSSHANVYRVHGLMTALILLKAASLFFHGVNFFFVSKYGQQSEIWAVVYYITHLLKGALLFGTIILIGTGYTFFKNFLTERDRKVFMVVLPLQIVDNIAMVILEESEFGQQGYQLWFEMFVFIDMICCFLIIFPIIWSMHHLSEGARSDGKAAFNLEKLRLFRHFYMIVISYVYLTRVMKLLLQYALPFDQEWVTDAVVELSTLVFFILVGILFRPQPANPYLKLNQDIDDSENISLTQNGLLEGVVNRGSSNGLIAPDNGGSDVDCPVITVEDNSNVSQPTDGERSSVRSSEEDVSGSPGGDDHERLRLLQKIELARERLKRTSLERERDVEEFLMMTQGSESQKGADNPQMARLKQHFEKKNKRHTNELEQLQRKLASYEQRLAEIENGIESGSRTTVMSTVGQGIRRTGANLKGMTETVMAAPLEFAQRLKSTFGSADNSNSPMRLSPLAPVPPFALTAESEEVPRQLLEDLRGLRYLITKMGEQINRIETRLDSELAYVTRALEEERGKFLALKQEQKGIANRLDYQYNDRFKRVEESVESVENHVVRMENSIKDTLDIRLSGPAWGNAVFLSSANIVVEFLKIVLYLVATVLDLFLPFFGTRNSGATEQQPFYV
ncbi:hypothetical protein GCK32_000805 [Trichostrongylus colubriformis]|uniref:GOST seven transmembrane domain-containing protein n=1 Tax=Trichostrongylus colubriformis TaxID=6319 RepID=A0AAN8IL35_TRICO